VHDLTQKVSGAIHTLLKIIMYALIVLGIFLLVKELDFGSLSFHVLVKELTVRILELVVLYELFKAVMSILEHERVKLIFLVDASISFILRELIIVIYSGKLTLELAMALALVLLVLGLLRIGVVRFSPDSEGKEPS